MVWDFIKTNGMTEEKVLELENINNPITKEAAEFIRSIIKSPYLDSYLTLHSNICDLNRQLSENSVDLFSDKDTKDFDRAIKYFTSIDSLLSTLDSLRNKMTPQEVLNFRDKEIVTHKQLRKLALEKRDT